MVGRYLTGKYAMSYLEIQTILNAGLTILPIFEVGGYELKYSIANQGISDAYSAIKSAENLGFPPDTIIYFAVDFDVLGGGITSAIIPYFKALKDVFIKKLSKYKIRIYAPRSVCSKISVEGYSCSSFVCDMSTGFSGNIGYPLPKDWAFDQISTISIGSGQNSVEIDNNISSCGNYKNSGVSKINPNIEEVVSLTQILETVAKVYRTKFKDNVNSRHKLLHNLFRSSRYSRIVWDTTLGEVSETDFLSYLYGKDIQLYKSIIPYIQNTNTLITFIHSKCVDLPHLSATTLGYRSSPLVPDF